MTKISKFQLFCYLIIMVGPIPFLKVPKRLIGILYHNAWLPPLAAIIPCCLVVLIYAYIIKKSHSPFPLLLEEHLGKAAGKLVGFIYILVFFIISAFTLGLFVSFVETNVLPGTPISVLIVSLLLTGYVGVKIGFEKFARVCEMIVFLGLPFTFLIIFFALGQNADIRNLLPVGYMSWKPFGLGIISVTSIAGRLFPVLTLAFFLPDRKQAENIMYVVVATFILMVTTTILGAVVTFGGLFSSQFTFPTFSMVRLIHISEFITNIDIIFIGIWILGIFGALTIPWLMVCYTTQQVFGLSDYRFIAAPSSLSIGILSLIMSKNILELNVITEQLIIYLYLIFLVLVPLLLFLVIQFKSYRKKHAADGPDKTAVGLNK